MLFLQELFCLRRLAANAHSASFHEEVEAGRDGRQLPLINRSALCRVRISRRARQRHDVAKRVVAGHFRFDLFTSSINRVFTFTDT